MNTKIFIFLTLIFGGVLPRVIPHPPNVSAVLAYSVFGILFLKDLRLAMLIPGLTMFLGDVTLEVLGKLGATTSWMVSGSGFYSGIYLNYIAVYLAVIPAIFMSDKFSYLRVLGSVISGSFIFFLISNLCVWSGGEQYYTPDLKGLVECYYMAIPFYRNSFVGDVFFASFILTLYKVTYGSRSTQFSVHKEG